MISAYANPAPPMLRGALINRTSPLKIRLADAKTITTVLPTIMWRPSLLMPIKMAPAKTKKLNIKPKLIRTSGEIKCGEGHPKMS